MALTDRERAIAGFAWSAGAIGRSIEEMDELLHTADAIGGFDAETIALSAAGKLTEEDVLQRLTNNIEKMRKAGA